MQTIDQLWLKWRDTFWQFFRFGIVGFVGFIVDWAMLHVGMDLIGLDPVAAGLFSFPFAVTATWIGNRVYTFKDAKPMSCAEQFTKFAIVCAVGLGFNRGTYSTLVTFVPLVHDFPVLGLLAGTAAGMFFNFFASKKHVFGA